jgi:hypothetical protein
MIAHHRDELPQGLAVRLIQLTERDSWTPARGPPLRCRVVSTRKNGCLPRGENAGLDDISPQLPVNPCGVCIAPVESTPQGQRRLVPLLGSGPQRQSWRDAAMLGY